MTLVVCLIGVVLFVCLVPVVPSEWVESRVKVKVGRRLDRPYPIN